MNKRGGGNESYRTQKLFQNLTKNQSREIVFDQVSRHPSAARSLLTIQLARHDDKRKNIKDEKDFFGFKISCDNIERKK